MATLPIARGRGEYLTNAASDLVPHACRWSPSPVAYGALVVPHAHRSKFHFQADPVLPDQEGPLTLNNIWSNVAAFCRLFLRIAVAVFVAPLAALITTFTTSASAQLTITHAPPSASSRMSTAAGIYNQAGHYLRISHLASPASTGVNSADIEAVLPNSQSLPPAPRSSGTATTRRILITRSPADAPELRTSPASAHQRLGAHQSTTTQYSPNTHTPAHLASAAMAARIAPEAATAWAQAWPDSNRRTSAARPQETLLVAGDGRDRVQDVLRALDNRLDNAISGAQGSALRSLPAMGAADPAAAEEARALVAEAVELVEQVWLDARGVGLDRARWLKDCQAELERRPPRDLRQAHLLIKDFLGRGPADPYTRFIPPEDFRQLAKYDISGAGVNLVAAQDFVNKLGRPLPRGRSPAQGGSWVVGLVKGAAADRAGIRQGDEVVAVDGAPVADLNPFEVATLICTPPPTLPTPPPAATAVADSASATTAAAIEFLTAPPVRAPGAAAPAATAGGDEGAEGARVRVVHEDGTTEEVAVARGRAAQAANPVTARMGRGSRGIVQLRTFNNRAVPEIKAAVARLQAQGATEIVLDLSDNRGGLVAEAVEIARLFLPPGATAVSSRGVASESVTRIDKGGTPITDLPLTVLVNRGSASASEILAGALRDNCRAVVAGAPTFGKGLIQSVYELSDGSGLAITVGKYLTPAGVDIDRSGIAPDFSRVPAVKDANTKLAGCVVPK
eukprot:jgi/Ulvmu1/10776/UM069_0010.1